MKKQVVVSLIVVFIGWFYAFKQDLIKVLLPLQDPVQILFTLWILASFSYLVYTKRHALKKTVYSSSQLGLVTLSCMAIVWIIANASSLKDVQIMTAFFMIPTLVLTVAGPNAVRHLVFPLSYVMLLIPFQYTFQLFFQKLITLLSSFLLSVLSVSVVIRKYVILETVFGELSVSNMALQTNNLLIWLSLAAFYAYFQFKTVKNKMLFCMAAVLLPVIADVIMIIWVGWFLGKGYSFNVVGLGLIFSVFVAAILLFYSYVLKHSPQETNLESEDETELSEWDKETSSRVPRWAIPTLIAVMLVISSPWLGQNIRGLYFSLPTNVLIVAPPGVQDWMGPELEQVNWNPQFLGANATVLVQYISKNNPYAVFLYSAHYSSSSELADLLSTSNTLYDPAQETGESHGIHSVSLGGNPFEVLETVVTEKREGTQLLVWHWYYVAGINSISPEMLKLLEAIRLISKYAEGPGVIAIAVSYNSQFPQRARDTLTNFLQAMHKPLDKLKFVEHRDAQ